jgi:hypothetical protein
MTPYGTGTGVVIDFYQITRVTKWHFGKISRWKGNKKHTVEKISLRMSLEKRNTIQAIKAFSFPVKFWQYV